jgi:alpha-N-arabinofuranosidase
MDGIGPHEQRPSIVNVHWGGAAENNACGTHEFLDLCQMLGAEPYIAGNVGSGTVREMAQWVEYITMPGRGPMADLRRKNGREEPWPLKFWGVGNENWGCGGNMRPEFYADLYRQYATFCRHFTPGGKLYKVACGLTDEWNTVLMREAGRFMDGLSVHYYTVPNEWSKKGSSTQFSTDEWKSTLQKASNIESFIKSTIAIMDCYDPAKRVGIVMDEWGTWYDVEPGTNPGYLYQQNTIRDALVAGLTLNIFNNYCERVHVANIAQTVNVLQSMILTEGSKMLRTPTYHAFEMYKVHQDATLLPTYVEGPEYASTQKSTSLPPELGYAKAMHGTPQVSASASRDASGKLHVSLVNLHHAEPIDLRVEFRGATVGEAVGRVLTAPEQNSHNTFEAPDAVVPAEFKGVRRIGADTIVQLPARSVVTLEWS